MAELDGGAPELRIETRPGPPPLISLAGELDSSNAARLSATVETALAERPERVVFELSDLRFMDSAGIAVLVRLAAEVDVVELRDPSPIVRRIIEITGLTGVLRVEP